MYWNMPRYENARKKASEVLSMLHYDPDEMVRTNDIIKAVEKMLDVDVKFSKFNFGKIETDTETLNALVNCGAMMCVSNIDGERRASILLNEKETPEMVRFSLVHELGHLVTIDWEKLDTCHVSTHIDMDITSIPDAVLNNPDYSFLIDEQVANIFALCVLIPYDSLMNAMSKYSSVEDVAECFGVEKSAVVSRLMLEEK